jgi:carbonic anhydrase
MVIWCCDSCARVSPILGADQGEFFIHRNVANLVPPYEPGGHHHGTSAAVEYAIRALHVAHLIVLGHSGCGGVQGCMAMCEGHAPEPEEATSFVGRWMDILRPGWERVKALEPPVREAALEKQAVVISLDNLMSFPFVAEAVEAGDLSLHGLWTDIGAGSLEVFDAETEAFRPL